MVMNFDKRFLFACFGWFAMGGKDAGSVKVQDEWLKVVIEKKTACTSLSDKGDQNKKNIFSQLNK